MAEPHIADNATTGSWRKLGGKRAMRGGSGRADALTWAGRASALLFFVAVVWLAVVLAMPLEVEGVASPTSIKDVPVLGWNQRDIQVRRDRIDGMTADYLFGYGRVRPESAEVASGDDLDGGEGGTDAGDDPVIITPGTRETVVSLGDITITRDEHLPDPVAQALKGLALKGIYRDPTDQRLAALIAFVHSSDPMHGHAYHETESFTDEKFPQAEWNLVSINPTHDLVILNRSDVHVALPMFRDERGKQALDSAVAESQAFGNAGGAVAAGDQRPPVRIETMTPAEVRRQLQDAGISDHDIRMVMALLDDPDAPIVDEVEAIESTVVAGSEQLEQLGGDEKDAKNQLRGMDAVLELMRSNPLAPGSDEGDAQQGEAEAGERGESDDSGG